jgi:hypothetical protein
MIERDALDKIRKILPLINSDKPGEAQAAAAALAKYDMRDVHIVLRGQQPASDFISDWQAKQQAQQQRQLSELHRQAKRLLDENSPLLTKVHRKSLNKVLQFTNPVSPPPLWHARAKFDATLQYWTERASIIGWQITPGASELESALKTAHHLADEVWLQRHDALDPKKRTELREKIYAAQAALGKAVEAFVRMPQTSAKAETDFSERPLMTKAGD